MPDPTHVTSNCKWDSSGKDSRDGTTYLTDTVAASTIQVLDFSALFVYSMRRKQTGAT